MSRPNGRFALVALGLLLLSPVLALAQQAPKTQRVQFKPGASSARINGSIKGYTTIDYLVGARQGQAMNVSLGTKHGATYFNILAPGETEVAFHIGSTEGNQYEGTLPATGDYRIRVYMMRSAARRNEVANYVLELSISGAGAAAGHQVPDARVAGTDYDATSIIRCWMGEVPTEGQCKLGVKRAGNGSGTVTVTKPDGRTRTIFFERGTATGYDQSEADRQKFRWDRADDETTVHIGSESYVIPDAVIYGG